MSFQNKDIDVSAIKIKEIQWFIELKSVGSVRELARRKSVQPGQVSKVIKSLERKIGVVLFDRSINGVILTLEGREVLPALARILEASGQVEQIRSKQKKEYSKQLTIASTSFMTSNIISKVISKPKFDQKYRFTLINLAPNEFVQVGLLGGFDICFHIGKIDWPKTWYSKKIAKLKWGLYSRKNHPIANTTSAKALKYPFVFPVYLTKEGLFEGNDLCPVPRNKRIVGHQTTTAQSAFEIIQDSNQLAFLPEVVATNRKIQKIKIKDWPIVSKNIYASVKDDIVQKKDFDELVRIFCQTIDQIAKDS